MTQTEKQLKHLHCFLKNVKNYEYLTGEDLDLNPSTIEQARFEFYLLVNFLIEDWKKKTKKKDF